MIVVRGFARAFFVYVAASSFLMTIVAENLCDQKMFV